MVQFIEKWIEPAQYAKKSPYAMKAETITVHNTANDASALREIAYMTTNDRYVSFHTAIDDMSIVQAIPYTRNAFHAGDGANGEGNRLSISIEICYSKSGGARYKQAEENAVQYIAVLLAERNWGIDRLRQHYHWSKKNCPHRIRDEKRWASFVARIEAALRTQRFHQHMHYSVVEGANAFRVQSGKYTTKEAAEQAAGKALASGALHYVTIIGVKE